MSALIEVAAAYAAAGIRVFPCDGKKPVRGFKWKTNAANDPARAAELFRKYPNANVAAIVPVGSVVIDLDAPKEPGGADGIAAIKAIAPAGWTPESEAMVAQTGRGGFLCGTAFPETSDRMEIHPVGSLQELMCERTERGT